ncbi:arginase family protein [Natronococcus occultus]|uniref:arginase family protein n=1 Tax=Natronococcus occultus TaxID=29288 RepID=UPI00373AF56E
MTDETSDNLYDTDGSELYGDAYDSAEKPIFSNVSSFRNLPVTRDVDGLEDTDPDIAIVGAPLDTGTTARPGARYGPQAIRAGFTEPSPPYCHFNVETGVDPFDTLKVVDNGDVAITPRGYACEFGRDRGPDRSDSRARYLSVRPRW